MADNWPWVWNVVGVRGSHYVALIALADAADEHGSLSHGLTLKKLSMRCNVSYETARQLTRDLQAWGLIDVEEWTKDNGEQVSNRYQLHKERLFPKTSDIEQSGEDIGAHIWRKLLEELERIRGQAEIHILKNEIRQAYFDASIRTTKTDQLHGVLYLIADTDIVAESYRQNLKYILKIRDQVPPYVFDYVQPIYRNRLKIFQDDNGSNHSEAL